MNGIRVNHTCEMNNSREKTVNPHVEGSLHWSIY